MTFQAKNVSLTWQLAHLKHFFGQKRTIASLYNNNPEFIESNVEPVAEEAFLPTEDSPQEAPGAPSTLHSSK